MAWMMDMLSAIAAVPTFFWLGGLLFAKGSGCRWWDSVR